MLEIDVNNRITIDEILESLGNEVDYCLQQVLEAEK
jgi:hypothetical protein